MAENEEVIKYLRRIEDKQDAQHAALTRSIQRVELTCNTLATERREDKEKIDDHEQRIRKNEEGRWKVSTYISLISGAVAASATAFADKFFNGG